MRLSPQAIQAFKAIWHEEYGENLSDAQAEEHAVRLLRLFQLLARPLPQDDPHAQTPDDHAFDNFRPTRTMEEDFH